MLEIRNLSAGYGHGDVIAEVSFTARRGEITTIIGKNGCGKTTLFKAATGMLPHRSGDVLVDGVSIAELSTAKRAQLMSYLAQGRGAPEITVGRMVLHGRFSHLGYPRRYSKKDYAIAAEMMEQMGLTELAYTPMSQLSGGMRQKVYIAMALAQQTPVVLMDEPTTYLDIAQQLSFGDMVGDLAQQGKAVLLVLHDLLFALRISHRIVVMDGGRVVACGTPEEIMASGVLERLYGVVVKSVETEQGTRLYYDV